jgi:hypothetical protein
MSWLWKQKPPEQTAATEARGYVRNAFEIAISNINEIFDNPSASSQGHSQVKEEEDADVPQTALLERPLNRLTGGLVLRLGRLCIWSVHSRRNALRSALQPECASEGKKTHDQVDGTKSGWHRVK